jgi:hypothetical protein
MVGLGLDIRMLDKFFQTNLFTIFAQLFFGRKPKFGGYYKCQIFYQDPLSLKQDLQNMYSIRFISFVMVVVQI